MIQKPFKNEAKTVPRGLQKTDPPRFWWVLAAKRRQEASKTAQEGPKRPPRRPKMAQDAPKTAQDGPSWLQKWSQNRRKIDGKIDRKCDASWNWFLEGFCWIFGGKMSENRRKMDGKIDRKSNASWSRFLEGQTVSKSWKIEKNQVISETHS